MGMRWRCDLGLQCGVLERSNLITEHQGMVALLRPGEVVEATELDKSMAAWLRGEPLPGCNELLGGRGRTLAITGEWRFAAI
jgi:hypothetical protein